jgi:hypothetical protein
MVEKQEQGGIKSSLLLFGGKMYITQKTTDSSLRLYKTHKEATIHSIAINKREKEHPSFFLYKVLNIKRRAKYVGILFKDSLGNYRWR